ncbi:MAG: quinolinate synthase NadA [Elusimicrobia bacterium]|nr:quinolinate synthase NadA [Elusimicrobiota bacterium]
MRALRAPMPSAAQLEAEQDRLSCGGLADLGFCAKDLAQLAALTWRINALKALRKAVIPGHVYQRPEILVGVADFIGDSYKLAKLCAETKAAAIVFCGVRFMAETAKILSPEKTVLLPAAGAGCSLSESITAADVRRLKAAHPGAPVAAYINTSAEVKAEVDVIVTSANAERILRRLYAKQPKVVFVPDEMMGRNLAASLGKKLGEELVIWKGSCIVHDKFDAFSIALYRKAYPGVRILAHTECSPALVALVDFVGGTGDMMAYVEKTRAPYYMLVTECGLGELARTRFPEKNFVFMCRLCPYMKMTDLRAVLRVLEDPSPSVRVEVPAETAARAKAAVRRMFELAEDTVKL